MEGIIKLENTKFASLGVSRPGIQRLQSLKGSSRKGFKWPFSLFSDPGGRWQENVSERKHGSLQGGRALSKEKHWVTRSLSLPWGETPHLKGSRAVPQSHLRGAYLPGISYSLTLGFN